MIVYIWSHCIYIFYSVEVPMWLKKDVHIQSPFTTWAGLSISWSYCKESLYTIWPKYTNILESDVNKHTPPRVRPALKQKSHKKYQKKDRKSIKRCANVLDINYATRITHHNKIYNYHVFLKIYSVPWREPKGQYRPQGPNHNKIHSTCLKGSFMSHMEIDRLLV